MTNKLQDEEPYDSLDLNPLVNTGLARKFEEVLRGKEPVANGHGEPLGFDLAKDNRTEFGFYWEFEDVAEAAKELEKIAIIDREAAVREAKLSGVHLVGKTINAILRTYEMKSNLRSSLVEAYSQSVKAVQEDQLAALQHPPKGEQLSKEESPLDPPRDRT